MLLDRLVQGKQLGSGDQAVGQFLDEEGRGRCLEERGAAFWALFRLVADKGLAQAAVAVSVAAAGGEWLVEEAVADLAGQERAEGLEFGFQGDEQLSRSEKAKDGCGSKPWHLGILRGERATCWSGQRPSHGRHHRVHRKRRDGEGKRPADAWEAARGRLWAGSAPWWRQEVSLQRRSWRKEGDGGGGAVEREWMWLWLWWSDGSGAALAWAVGVGARGAFYCDPTRAELARHHQA